MKSQVRIVLALLLVLSSGLAVPSFAGDADAIPSSELVRPVKGSNDTIKSADDTGETNGDPDGWLGGQNLRPVPPVESGSDEEDGLMSGGSLADSLLSFFLMFIGVG